MSQYQLVTDCFFEKTKVGGDVDTKDSAAAGMEILFFLRKSGNNLIMILFAHIQTVKVENLPKDPP